MFRFLSSSPPWTDPAFELFLEECLDLDNDL